MRLDNPLLTANGILSKLDEIRVDPSVQAAFKREDEGQPARLMMLPMEDRLKLYSSKEQRYLAEKAHGLTSLRKKLITAYFTGIDQGLILQEIEQLRLGEFPRLQYILRQIFSVATHPGITEIPPELVDWIKPANYPDKHFQDLNSKYGYFSVEVLANATAIFDALKPLCRKMTCLIERQADDSEMAYKLMALFCLNENLGLSFDPHKCFENIAIAFDKLPGSTKRPYHDFFVVGLEPFPRASDANDIMQWHRFIQKDGFHALPFFADCKSFDTVPNTLLEAKETQFKKIYPRAAENTAFARFCKVFRIDNEGFEAGLDFIATGWPKKDSDNLPLVDIRLIEDRNEYRWVKLPTNDLRALYLGNMIPYCCQFINGHSRQCVIDGTSLTDNGFYVLLKKKIKTGHDEHKEDASSRLELDGDIVAQSYAWISKNGNLCLDSIEWDDKRVKEPILKEIIGQFSAQVLDENRQIHYVNVGTGGQTPENFPYRAIISEIQRQGTQYNDSFEQYCLASRVQPDQIEKLKTKLQEFDEEFSRNFLYLAGYFESIDAIGNIAEIENLLTKTFFKPFPAIDKTLTHSDFRALTFKEYQQLDEPEKKQISTFCKKLNTQKLRNFLEWLPEIPESERLNFVKQEVKGIDSSSEYEGSVLYVLAARNPQYLMDVLHLIPEHDRLAAVKNETAFPALALGDHHYLIDVLRLIPEQDRLAAVKEKLRGETILHFSANKPEYLCLMLPLIPEQDRLAALINIDEYSGEAILHIAASNPESLNVILSFIPEQDRLATLGLCGKNKETVLHIAACNPKCLEMILELFPKDQDLLATLIDRKDNDGATVLHYAAIYRKCFKMIFQLIPAENRLKALAVKDIFLGQTVYEIAQESLIETFHLIPENNRQEAVKYTFRNGQTILHLAARDPKSLTDILLLIPENERLEALKGGTSSQTAYDIAFGNSKTMEVILRLCKENDPGPSSINYP